MTTNSVLVAQPSSLPDKVKRLRAGQVIGERYELISLIGQGGMGEVWKAQARNRPNPVALKLLPPEFCSVRQQQRMRERFSLVERLAHPNICTVMDLDVDAEIGPFLVMRYLEGITRHSTFNGKEASASLFSCKMFAIYWLHSPPLSTMPTMKA